LALSVFLRAIR